MAYSAGMTLKRALAALIVSMVAILSVPASASAFGRPVPKPATKAGTCPVVYQVPAKVRVQKCADGRVVVWRWDTNGPAAWKLAFIAA